MKNRRIGRINGKVVLMDTPPYNDKKARSNEIISNVDSIISVAGSVFFKKRMYPVAVSGFGDYNATLADGRNMPYRDLTTVTDSFSGSRYTYMVHVYKDSSGAVGANIVVLTGSVSNNRDKVGLYLVGDERFSMPDICRRMYPEEMRWLDQIL